MIWIEGAWQPEQAVSGDDRGDLLGDGLFETMTFRQERVVRLDRHLVRLQASLDRFGLPADPQALDLQGAAARLSAENGLSDAAIRLTISAGSGPRGLARPDPVQPVIRLAAAPLASPPLYITLASVAIRRSPDSPAAVMKTLSYADNVVARRDARGVGADMALMTDTAGRLSGGDCANLFWVEKGELFTPSLACAVLPGTARAALLAAFDVQEVEDEPAVLREAEGVFVTNALMGAVPVSRIDQVEKPVDDDVLAAVRDCLAATDYN